MDTEDTEEEESCHQKILLFVSSEHEHINCSVLKKHIDIVRGRIWFRVLVPRNVLPYTQYE